MEKDPFCLRYPPYPSMKYVIFSQHFDIVRVEGNNVPYAMVPVWILITYKDVPYTFLFMNRIRTPKGKDRDPDGGDSAAGSSHGGGRYF